MAWDWAVDDIAEVGISSTIDGQKCLNVLHYRLDTAALTGGFVASEDLFTRMADPGLFIDVMRAACAPELKIEDVGIQRIHPVRQRRYDFLVNLVGTNPEHQAASNLAATIEKFTENATSHVPGHPAGQVGSFHLPGPPYAQIQTGQWTDAYIAGPLTDLANEIAALIVTAGGNHWVPVIYHRKAAPPSWDDIEGCFPQHTVRVARRRTVGVGQ